MIQNLEYNLMAVMAFRESGKSTIMNLANILWSILGKHQKRLILIISKTQEQAKSHFTNIKYELENNELLKEAFGPFTENQDDLKRLSLELVYHGAKIMSVTREQSIRGLKYGQLRPDLIICDDLEDISSSLDKAESAEVYRRFQQEIMPLGSSGTRIVILGNLISEDSLMMKLREDINNRKLKGVFRTYPFSDDYGNILWLKYSDTRSLRSKLSRETWKLEYLLNLNLPTYWKGKPPPEELPDPVDEETYMKAISDRCNYKLSCLDKKYIDILYIPRPQKALIGQMDKFTISAPIVERLPQPDKDNPNYEKYQKYNKEIREVQGHYKEGLKKTIRAYWSNKEKVKELANLPLPDK